MCGSVGVGVGVSMDMCMGASPSLCRFMRKAEPRIFREKCLTTLQLQYLHLHLHLHLLYQTWHIDSY